MRALLAVAALASPAAAQIPFPDPPIAPDINPDPNIVEVDLVAAETTWQYIPGVDTTVWAYNGTVPGPTITARVGDLVRVNFTNNLPEATTIHWHGAEVPATMDGAHFGTKSGVSQLTIQPGDSFTYEFRLELDALYWYHPHVRTFDQVEKGLYGALLIRDTVKESQLGLNSIEEKIVFFDDILLDANHQVVPAFSFTDPLENALYHLNGREGNHLLVNGKVADQVRLTLQNGAPVRWRAVNAANTTICRLDLRDQDEGLPASMEVYEIGSDGGFINEPFERLKVTNTAPSPLDHPGQSLINEMGQGVFLFPGERMDVVFNPTANDGDVFRVYQKDWFRGRHAAVFNSSGTMILLPDDPMDGNYPDQEFIEIELVGAPASPYTPPSPLETIPIPPGDPAGTIPLTFGHGLPDPNTGAVTLFAQADFSTGSMVPLPAPKVTSFDAHDVVAGETYIWEVTNLTHGDHPFHTHGFFFQLLEYEFQDDDDPNLNFRFAPVSKRMLKDTIRLPARLGAKGRSRTIARLLVHFDDSAEREIVAMGEEPTFAPDGSWTSGGWLTHCHILEHSGKGMLTFYELHDPNEIFTLHGRFLPGTNGNASLTGEGDLTPGTPVLLHLVDALPSQDIVLLGGNRASNRPFKGGTLVPGYGSLAQLTVPGQTGEPLGGPLFAYVDRGTTHGNGSATFTINNWEQAPSGTELYFQVVIPDPGAPQGFALSNAISFTRP